MPSPTFPSPAIVFQVTSPRCWATGRCVPVRTIDALADHYCGRRHRRRRGRRHGSAEDSCSPRRSPCRTGAARGWCRSASRASCRGSHDGTKTYDLEYGTDELEMHVDAFGSRRPGPRSSTMSWPPAGRQQPRWSWSPRARRATVVWCSGSWSSSGFLGGRRSNSVRPRGGLSWWSVTTEPD